MSQLVTFLDALHPAFVEGDPHVKTKVAEAEVVRLVRELYSAIARGDFVAFTEAFDDDVCLEIAGPAELPFAGRWEGKAKVLEAVQHNFSLVEEQYPVVESVVAQGDTVVVLFEESGRVRATGKDYRLRCVQVFTFRGGKLARMRQVADSAPAVVAFKG